MIKFFSFYSPNPKPIIFSFFFFSKNDFFYYFSNFIIFISLFFVFHFFLFLVYISIWKKKRWIIISNYLISFQSSSSFIFFWTLVSRKKNKNGRKLENKKSKGKKSQSKKETRKEKKKKGKRKHKRELMFFLIFISYLQLDDLNRRSSLTLSASAPTSSRLQLELARSMILFVNSSEQWLPQILLECILLPNKWILFLYLKSVGESIYGWIE